MAWTAAHQERADRITASRTLMPATLDRTAFEVACAAIGCDAPVDRAVPGFAYAEYGLDDDPTGTAEMLQSLCERREAAMKIERAARPRPAPVAEVPCPVCGTLTAPSMLMSASRGRCCPDCYDRMS